MKKNALGRGLDALMPQADYENSVQEVDIGLVDINPGQPRKNFDQDALQQLADSISQVGLLQPILVLRKGDRFAIIAGERDAHKLLLLCDSRIIKAKSEDMLKALEGNFNDSWIFLLERNLHMWKLHEQQLASIDKKIEELLRFLEAGKEPIAGNAPAKPIRHHRPNIAELHQTLLNIYGVDGNTLSGITDYTLLRLLAEVGPDMGRFPTVKQFVSWCQLAPACNQSGKMNRRIRVKAGSRPGQIFREVAQGLLNSKHIAIGAFMRRIRARKDSKIAVKAGARKLAEAFYNLLTKGAAYVEQGVKKYEEQLKNREKTFLYKLAQRHNMQLVSSTV